MDKGLFQKLIQVQKEIKAIKKEQNNPFFKSKYFDINAILAEVKPILTENGLVLNQPIETDGQGRSVLVTQITDVETEKCLRSAVYLPEIPEPQKMGSAITYYRRYALQALLSLEAEDDDGNAASYSKPAPVSRPLPKKTAKSDKEIIWDLLVNLQAIDPDTATAEDCQKAVKQKTDLSLIEKNYDNIITRLEALTLGQ